MTLSSSTVSVNPAQEAPEPMADFEFSTNGSDTKNRWQVFNFDVVAGELIEADVLWDDPNANLRVFLRDESNTQIERNTVGIASGIVSGVAFSQGLLKPVADGLLASGYKAAQWGLTCWSIRQKMQRRNVRMIL